MDIRVAAYAVVIDEDSILLAHWSEGPHPAWTLPGGGLEEGESPEAAAVREVREETGLDLVLDGLLGVDSRVIPLARRLTQGATQPLHTLRIVYRGHVVGGVLTDETDGTTDEARWFPLAEVPSIPHVKLVDVALEMARATR